MKNGMKAGGALVLALAPSRSALFALRPARREPNAALPRLSSRSQRATAATAPRTTVTFAAPKQNKRNS